MIGIIYKFTIKDVDALKEKSLFYIGQHWEKISVENFLSTESCRCYTGGGSLWGAYVNKLKNVYRIGKWRKYIHREVLYAKEGISQKALDALEAHYIKKYKAHYSFGLGGCNIAWGSVLNGVNPSTDPKVKKKISKSLTGRRLSSEHRRKLLEFWTPDKFQGEKNPNYGHKWSADKKEEMSRIMIGRYDGEKNPNYGKRWTEKMKKNLSGKLRKFYDNGGVNAMSGRKRITNGIINKTISSDEPLPNGWRYGMISKPDRKPLPPFMWITNGVNNKRVPKDSVIPKGWRKGKVNSFNRK